jgi:serine/threonine protein kinase
VFQKGDQIGSYTLIEKLGKGAFGEVWLAEEKTAISAHRFALKLPNEEDVDLEAIRQEADVWENVKGHPNILPIIKADIFEGQIYIASEYAPDGSLSVWLKKHNGKAPTIELAVQMIKGILAGLEHLHSKGVIHRDLKPANILLQSETPRIADFGIARLAKSETTNSALSAGTPSYMAPECFYSVRSEQTDIWAVGVLFHKLLSGKLPFSHPDQVSVMNAVLNGEPAIDDEIPENLRQVIRTALQKDTAQRYKSAAEMREALNNVSLAELTGEEPISQRAIPVAAIEKEEETIVRQKPAPVQVEPQIIYERIEPASSGNRKTLIAALSALLILAAVTTWAAFQFAGDEPAPRTDFPDLSNTSNLNSNLTNVRGATGNSANFTKTTDEKKNLTNSSANSNVEVPALSGIDEPQQLKRDENPSATPYNIQRDDTNPNINGKPRSPRTEPTTAEDDTPPLPSKTPAENTPTPSTGLRPRTTPKPTQKTEETPPPLLEKGN